MAQYKIWTCHPCRQLCWVVSPPRPSPYFLGMLVSFVGNIWFSLCRSSIPQNVFLCPNVCVNLHPCIFVRHRISVGECRGWPIVCVCAANIQAQVPWSRAPVSLWLSRKWQRCQTCTKYCGVFVVWRVVILCLLTVCSPQTYLLGIIISICGNILISISLNIQVGRPLTPVKTHFSSLWAQLDFLPNSCPNS